MFKKEYDVFLAYHGSYEGGTREICGKLYNYLQSRGLTPFYFPEANSDNYTANIAKVVRSKTFLLVCNELIHTNKNGQLDKNKHYSLATEIDSFYSLLKEEGDTSFEDAKVLVCGDYYNARKKGDEEHLHPLFGNRTHLYYDENEEQSSFENVYAWITKQLRGKKEYNPTWRTYSSAEIERIFFERSLMSSYIDLPRLISESHSILVAGVSNREIIPDNQIFLLDAIQQNNATVEIIYLDPDSSYATEHDLQEMGEKGDISKLDILARLKQARDFKNNLPQDLQNNCKFYKYSGLPRLNLIVLDECAIIQYYADKTFGGKSPCFYIKKQKDVSPFYEYCKNIHKTLKSHSVEI